jgi:hypothetical protein
MLTDPVTQAVMDADRVDLRELITGWRMTITAWRNAQKPQDRRE